jgi:hypothetical protein
MLLFISLNSFHIIPLKEKGTDQENDRKILVKGKKIQVGITCLLSKALLKSVAQ